MKLPRSISARELIDALAGFGYRVSRQKGSHIRLTTEQEGTHHVTIPDQKQLRIGTFASILAMWRCTLGSVEMSWSKDFLESSRKKHHGHRRSQARHQGFTRLTGALSCASLPSVGHHRRRARSGRDLRQTYWPSRTILISSFRWSDKEESRVLQIAYPFG